MTDYNSLISAVANLLSDKSPDVVMYAQSAIVEMGKPAASKVSSVLIRELNSFSSNTPKNRPAILQAIRDVCKYSPEPGLAHLVTPPVIDLLTFLPPLEPEITGPCCEILHNFADRNALDVVREFKEINVTRALTEFLIERAKKNEQTFFSSGDRPTLLFMHFCQGISKVVDNETRIAVVNLLTHLADLFAQQGNCPISNNVGEAMELMASTWLRTSPIDVQKEVLGCLGTVISILGGETIKQKIEPIAISYCTAMSNKELKYSAARGVSSLLMAAERSGCKPNLPTTTLTKSLYDFISAEMGQMQSDGLVMRSVNEAVGGLATLMSLSPPHPLDFVNSKLPSAPALLCLSYMSSSLAGQSESVATSIIKELSKINFNQLKVEQKELYANCFFTLLRKISIQPNEQLTTIFKNVSLYIASNTTEARGCAHSFVAAVKQSEGAYLYLYPAVLKFLFDPAFFYASPSLAEAAAYCVPHFKEHTKALQNENIDRLELAALVLTLSESSLMTGEAKSCLKIVAGSLLDVSGADVIQAFVHGRHPEEHTSVLTYTQKLVNTYGGYSVNNKPIFSPTIRSAYRGGAAIVCGKLMKSQQCLRELEETARTIINRIDRGSFVELESVAAFLGIVSEVQPDFSVGWVKRSVDIIIANNENKWKFWAKKEEPALPAAAVLLSAAEICDRATTSLLSNLFRQIEEHFVGDESVAAEIRMRALAAGFRKAHSDGSFTIGDGRRLAVMADAALKSAKTPSEVVAGIDAVTAAYVFQASLIGSPDTLIKNSINAIRSDFAISDINNIISHVADVAVSVVSGSSSDNGPFVAMFHSCIERYLVNDSHFDCCIASMLTVLNACRSVTPSPEFLKVAIFCAAVTISSGDSTAKTATTRAFLLNGTPLETDPLNSDNLTATQIVTALAKEDKDLTAIVEAAAALSACPFAIQRAAVDIVRAASARAAEGSAAGDFAALLFRAYGAGLDVKDCFDALVAGHAAEAMGALLRSEYSRRLSNVVAAIVARRETASAAVGALVDALEALDGRAATVLRVMADCGQSLRLAEFRERGVFAALAAGLLLDSEGKEWAAAIVGTECAATSVPIDAFRSLLERSRSDASKLLSLSERIMEKSDKIQREVALAAAAAVIETTEHAEIAHRAVSLIVQNGADEASVDAIGSIAKAKQAIRQSEGLRAVEFLGAAPRGLAARSMAAVVSGLSDAQMRDAAASIIGFATGALAEGPEEAAPAALRVVPLAAGSNAMMCAEGGLRAASALYPLCLVHAYATDRELAMRAAGALGRRLALPEPRGGFQSFPDFADANVGAALQQVKERAAFAEAAERAMGHESARVRAAAVYLATAVAAERPSAVARVGEAMRDESEEVRAAALRTVTALECAKH